MKKKLEANSPEFRDLVGKITTTNLSLPLLPKTSLPKVPISSISVPSPPIELKERISLTQNKDTDIIILQQLSDSELGKVCKVNKYVNSICNDDKFWLNRLIIKLKFTGEEATKLRDYLGYNNFKELYVYLQTFQTKMTRNGKTLTIDRQKYVNFLRKGRSTLDDIINRNIKTTLPVYVDRNLLTVYLRRQFPIIILNRKFDNDRKFDLGISFHIMFNKLINDPGYYEDSKNYTGFDF